jgi:hypothetical protein
VEARKSNDKVPIKQMEELSTLWSSTCFSMGMLPCSQISHLQAFQQSHTMKERAVIVELLI